MLALVIIVALIVLAILLLRECRAKINFVKMDEEDGL